VALFSAAGGVERVTIPGYPWAPQGFAYLEFKETASAVAAVEQLDGADFKGRALKVNKKGFAQQGHHITLKSFSVLHVPENLVSRPINGGSCIPFFEQSC